MAGLAVAGDVLHPCALTEPQGSELASSDISLFGNRINDSLIYSLLERSSFNFEGRMCPLFRGQLFVLPFFFSILPF